MEVVVGLVWMDVCFGDGVVFGDDFDGYVECFDDGFVVCVVDE